MNSLLILIPIALLLLGVAVWAFVWAVDHQQFDDLDEEAQRILFDEPGEASSRREARDAEAEADADAPDEHV